MSRLVYPLPTTFQFIQKTPFLVTADVSVSTSVPAALYIRIVQLLGVDNIKPPLSNHVWIAKFVLVTS